MTVTTLIFGFDGIGPHLLRAPAPTPAELGAIAFSLRKRLLSDALGTPIDEWRQGQGLGRSRADEPDRRVVEILADPFESVDDTYDRLAATERYLRGRGDRRSVFFSPSTSG